MPDISKPLEFKELGLTSNETKVYETMLRLGKATAGHICKESQVPYGRIYNVLASLEEKGLVRTIPEDTKKYVPTSPDKLHEIIDSRIKNLMEIDNKVKELKKLYEDNPQEPVLVAKGKSNFIKLDKEMKKAEKYAYSIKYGFEPNPIWMREIKNNIQRGVDIKTLGTFNKDTQKAIKEWNTVHKEIKPIDNEGCAISLIDDNEILIGLIKSNTTLLIRDKAFVKLFRQLFTKYYAYTAYPEERIEGK